MDLAEDLAAFKGSSAYDIVVVCTEEEKKAKLQFHDLRVEYDVIKGVVFESLDPRAESRVKCFPLQTPWERKCHADQFSTVHVLGTNRDDVYDISNSFCHWFKKMYPLHSPPHVTQHFLRNFDDYEPHGMQVDIVVAHTPAETKVALDRVHDLVVLKGITPDFAALTKCDPFKKLLETHRPEEKVIGEETR